MTLSTLRRAIAAVAVAAFGFVPGLGVAAPPATPRPAPVRADAARPIEIVVNDTTLEPNPSPRVVDGRLLVPVIKIFGALAISVANDGDSFIATAPTRTIRFKRGSSVAFVDNTAVQLSSKVVELDGSTFVPVTFLTAAIGADVAYDQKTARLIVTSAALGRVKGLTQTVRGTTIYTGSVTAIDRNSTPAAITIASGGQVQTISINSDAKVTIQDVKANTATTGTIDAVRVGDQLTVQLRKDGSVAEVTAFYASRVGTAAAVAANTVVLGDGFVVAPDRATEVTLNGRPAQISDLAVGDAITVRLNPKTGEKRQIIAVRAGAATPSPVAGSVVISSFTFAGKRILKAADGVDITLVGTPGGSASYDIGPYIVDQPLREGPAGTYTGRFTVPPGVNFGSTPVYGHLRLGDAQAPRAQAVQLLAIATTGPAIPEIAPSAGQTVNSSRPSIFATFSTPTDLGVNASAVSIEVNGLDVTASAVRTPTFITYQPSVDLADGPVKVVVKIADNAGNTAARSWAFTIRTK